MTDDRPLVVQADHTILVESAHPRFEEARRELGRFAELQKSPEFVHFYRVTPISVWNAAALGVDADAIVGYLERASRYPVAASVSEQIRDWHARYGCLRLTPAGEDRLWLSSTDSELLASLHESKTIGPLLAGAPEALADGTARVAMAAANRGVLKHCLIKRRYPVQDEAGYEDGAPLSFGFRATRRADARPFALRDYQVEAAAAFWADGTAAGGCGVIVLPCGAGKTVVGMAAIERLQTRTLVLTTNAVAVRQWRSELLDKTSLTENEVGEYTGERKDIAPVTIATYQILTYRRRKTDAFEHFALFESNDWGLIVYDEVHLLPAPVFRATAAIQARRRLGLTATLVREDGKEGDVFSLIGPKRYELPWRELERAGWLAPARCVEVRVELSPDESARYRAAGARARLSIAGANARKDGVVARLLEQHAGDRVLVIGQYLEQLRRLAALFDLPLITGKTPMPERVRLFDAFRRGEIERLVVSKVGNFAIDLPDANVAIQVSGTFGSRQEEAQRLGRVLRPKDDGRGATFYSVVSQDTCDQEFCARRQLFLAEQGYRYEIVSGTDVGTPRTEASS